jgi:hypothetical protein
LLPNYEAFHIWNCDESRTQARQNGGRRVLAKNGVKNVYTIITKEHEWLFVLYCINIVGYHIPSFYIFRGKYFQHNYIKQCEANVSMGMQAKAWMTRYLSKYRITHFV